MASRRTISLLPVFITVFIDLIGVGIVIPVLAPLFLAPDSPLAHLNWSLATKTIVIGWISAMYPIAMFFGAPYLGALSDRWGRKPVLVMSLIGTFIGYLFFALAIKWHAIWLLFLSRALDGFTGGNISTAYSAISDLSDGQDKAGHFGMIGMAYGLGFILGPFIGGKLASIFNPAAPFWFAAGITLLNVFLVMLFFRETLQRPIRSRMSLLTGAKNVIKAFQRVDLRVLFLIEFLFVIGFNFFTQFFQVLAIQKYQFTVAMIGTMFAYIGVWVALTQGLVTRAVARRWKPQQVLSFSLLLWALTLALVMVPRDMWVLYAIAPFMALAVGLSIPNATAAISNMADRQSQGEVMGINQSVNALAMAIPPGIAGLFAALNVYFPIALAALFVFASWIVLMIWYHKPKQPLFHEI